MKYERLTETLITIPVISQANPEQIKHKKIFLSDSLLKKFSDFLLNTAITINNIMPIIHDSIILYISSLGFCLYLMLPMEELPYDMDKKDASIGKANKSLNISTGFTVLSIVSLNADFKKINDAGIT